MRLSNKTIFVTGAGSGMGRLAAQMFSREGAQIVAVDVSEGALRDTVVPVQSAGGSIVGAQIAAITR